MTRLLNVLRLFGWPVLAGALVAVVLAGPELHERDWRTVFAAWFIATYVFTVMRAAFVAVKMLLKRWAS